MRLEFTKMHGLGNDFVVIDNTDGRLDFQRDLAGERISMLAERRFGVGFDQMLVVEQASVAEAEFDYRIYNADGSEVEHCGNGARCFAIFVRERGLTQSKVIPVNTVAGLLSLEILEDRLVKVLMGVPEFAAAKIPVLPEQAETVLTDTSPNTSPDTLRLRLGLENAPELSETENASLQILSSGGASVEFSALAIGNPHIVLRVNDVDTAPVTTLGPWLETHPMFPSRVNVGFLQVLERNSVRLRVFERGVGETLACGSGACAALVAAVQQNWTDSHVEAHLNGGKLALNWPGSGHNVEMTGPCTKVFEGDIEL